MPKFITKAGLLELQAEYQEILNVKIPENLSTLNSALAQGDLSENAERDAALVDQGRLQTRTQEIEEILNDYELIDENAVAKSKTVIVGSLVKLSYSDRDEVYEVKIMGSSEADILSPIPKISNESPLGQAILGKASGASVEFRVKHRTLKVKILEILE